MDVSVKMRGVPQLLAQLGAGSVFGQVSLILDTPRTASCSVHRDAEIATIDRDSCKALLDADNPLSRKLLGVLMQSVVEALRAADRRLMRMEQGAVAGHAAEAAVTWTS